MLCQCDRAKLAGFHAKQDLHIDYEHRAAEARSRLLALEDHIGLAKVEAELRRIITALQRPSEAGGRFEEHSLPQP